MIVRKKARIWRAVFTVVAFLCIYGSRTLEGIARENLKAFAEMHIAGKANELLTTALADSLWDIELTKLLEVYRNSKDEIELVGVNTLLINRVQATCTAAIQRAVEQLGEYTVRIPLGQFLGSVVFASMGPAIPVKLIPLGFAGFSIRDRFESAGINQTRLSFYADVSVKVRVIVPLVSYDLTVMSSVPLATLVVPGRVPTGLFQIN